MTLYMVELAVADVTRSVAWYRDVLGLTVEMTDEPNGFVLLAPCPVRAGEKGEVQQAHPLQRVGFTDGQRIALKRGAPPSAAARLHFLVPDLTAELARLAALGVRPESAPDASPEGYRRAAFRDPDGHSVTLFEWVTSSPAPSRP